MRIIRLLTLTLTLGVASVACKPDAGGASASAAQTTTTAAAAPSAVAPTPAAAPAVTGKLLGSCMIMSVACSDYYGAASPEPLKKACQGAGKWSDGACPSAAVQGTCTKSEPGGITNKARTYAPGTKASSKKACDNTPGGVFSE